MGNVIQMMYKMMKGSVSGMTEAALQNPQQFKAAARYVRQIAEHIADEQVQYMAHFEECASKVYRLLEEIDEEDVARRTDLH